MELNDLEYLSTKSLFEFKSKLITTNKLHDLESQADGSFIQLDEVNNELIYHSILLNQFMTPDANLKREKLKDRLKKDDAQGNLNTLNRLKE